MRDPNPINIRALDHVVLRVADLEGMVAWYCDVLGCRLERGPGELGLAQLRAGSALIDLIDVAGPLGRQGGAAPSAGAAVFPVSAVGAHVRSLLCHPFYVSEVRGSSSLLCLCRRC